MSYNDKQLTQITRYALKIEHYNTRAKRLRMRNVSIFFHNKNACFELKSNFINIQNFKAGNVKPPGMYWSKDF